MNGTIKRSLALAAIPMALAWAGSLTLEIGNPDANPEAKNLNAVLVARVTACHEPAKSTVSASFVQSIRGEIERTPLKVVPLKTGGLFAIVGPVPRGGAIDLAVTNPEFRDYKPRVLIRSDSNGIQWASVKRFYSTPPTDTDLRAILGAVD